MKFSGHETFSIRDGWLHKGLRLLHESPDKFEDEHVADWLGVGRNMAKAIRYWLSVTGLAEPADNERYSRKLKATDFGKLVYKHDRYFSEPGTWWMLHINLVHNQYSTVAWTWFFNKFGETRFDRHYCLEGMVRYVSMSAKRPPSRTTMQKDLSCLLASYARKIPEERVDAEEALDCPFVELGLMDNFRSSGTFQLNRERKLVLPQILGFSLARSYGRDDASVRNVSVKVTDAASAERGPGRCFIATDEALIDMTREAEETCDDIGVVGLAGDRAIRFINKPTLNWAQDFYKTAH